MAKQNPGRVLASAAQGSKSDVDAKLKGVAVEEVAAVEAESAAAAAAAPVVDAAMLASAESIFAADASPVLVAQAGGASGGMLAGGVSTGTLLAVGAGVLAIGGAVALASSGDDDNDDDDNGGGNPTPVTPTITVSAAPASITEGGSGVTYTITTTGFAAGQSISYNLSSPNGAITEADVDQRLSGLITLDSNGRAIFTVSALSDGITEGAESLTFVASSGTLATSNTVTTTINDQQVNQVFRLTTGVDSGPAFVGTAGADTFDGRGFTFDQFDTLDGGAGVDRILTDFSVQDVFFTNTKGIEIVATGGDAELGAVAAAAGVQRADLLGTAGDADITGFNAALTVNGNAGANDVFLSLADDGAKTLNLGGGIDRVFVASAPGAAAGGTQVNFTSGSVGNGSDSNVTLVNAAGNVVVNDEGTVLVGDIANQFNVVGLDASGAVDSTQNRGNFQTVVLGTQGVDVLDTGSFTGNVYINAGSGNDELFGLADDAGERHFLVGGAGNDVLNLETVATGLVVAIAGAGDDAVNVDFNDGRVNVSLNDGDDTVTFTGALELNTAGANSLTRDTLDGGAGRDTLAASSAQLTAVDNTVANAVQSISNFEALTVTSTLAAALNVTRVQAGIDTVTLAAGTNGDLVTFGGGVAGTLNLGAVAGGTINLASAGTGTSDALTVANTAAAVAGVAVDAFGGSKITTTGVETLTVNTSAAGSATRQDIGGITGTTLATVKFVGGNAVDAGTVAVKAVDASGLTAGGLTVVAGFTGAANNVGSIAGSAGADAVTYTGTQFIAVNTGAGADKVTVTALDVDTIRGTLNGGEGTDTLAMSAAVAAAATVPNTPVSTRVSGFEVLELGSSAGANTIDLRFLGTTQKVISAGTTAAGLSILNLDNGGTLELTGALLGAASVTVRDADLRTTDSLNIVLNGAGALANAAAELTANNIETININSTFSGAMAPAVVSTLDLVASVATSIVVTGNNGLDFTGSTLGQVTSFDASGVTAGGVTFAAQKAAATTIVGGAGDDVLSGFTGSDTITLGAGADTVVFAATRVLNGNDTVNGFKAGARGDNGGDLLDLNGIGDNVEAFDGNGDAAGLSFNATASNTRDLNIVIGAGNNSQVHVVIDGASELTLGNVKADSSNTAQFGEILVADNASQYVLHASSDGSSVAQLYRVFDSNGAAAGSVAAVELIGSISLTNTVGDLVRNNLEVVV